jgi:flagellar basal body P-ring formation protein FlgA
MLQARCLAAVLSAVLTANGLCAAEPVIVELQAESKVQLAVVTIGDVAQISGGDAAIRERVARLDLADVKPREQSLIVTRRVLDYRIRLAGE